MNSSVGDKIKIGLVDDHKLFREGIKSLLSPIEYIKVVLEASDGHELLNKLSISNPDIVLLDLEMDGMDGIEAFKVLQRDFPLIKVIVLTMYTEHKMITHLMELGVHGYLTKDSEKEEFEKAIVSVYEKGQYFNEVVSKALLESIKKRSKKIPSLKKNIHLTSREIEVLDLIAKECTTLEISQKLFLSPKTIEGHRKNLISKFQVKNSTGLVVKAIQENYLVLE